MLMSVGHSLQNPMLQKPAATKGCLERCRREFDIAVECEIVFCRSDFRLMSLLLNLTAHALSVLKVLICILHFRVAADN